MFAQQLKDLRKKTPGLTQTDMAKNWELRKRPTLLMNKENEHLILKHKIKLRTSLTFRWTTCMAENRRTLFQQNK